MFSNMHKADSPNHQLIIQDEDQNEYQIIAHQDSLKSPLIPIRYL